MSHSTLQPILDRPYDGEKDARVSLPEEESFDALEAVSLPKDLELAVIEPQHNDRHIDVALADFLRELGRVHIAHVRARDDEVHLGPLAPEDAERVASGRNPSEERRFAWAGLQELTEHPFVQVPVLGEDEGLVQGRDEEDMTHLLPHETAEAGGPRAEAFGKIDRTLHELSLLGWTGD